MTTAAVVLAAGGATRWEGAGHKLLAELNGQPLAAWAITSAHRASLDELVVVTGSVDLSELLPRETTLIKNERWREGQSTSLQVAVDHCRHVGHQALVVGLADMPGVPSSAWKAVASSNSPLATATFTGQRRPPVKLGREVWDQLPDSGDQGARTLLTSGVWCTLEVPCDGRGDDIDTVEDLQKWT